MAIGETGKRGFQWATLLAAVGAVLVTNIESIAEVLPADQAVIVLLVTNLLSGFLPGVRKSKGERLLSDPGVVQRLFRMFHSVSKRG